MNKFLQLTVLCTLLLCTSLSTKAAYVIKFSDIDFDVATNSITAYHNTTEKDIEIPTIFFVGSITHTVKKIGESAFASKDLTAVVIPNTVDSIMNSAFRDNLLTSVVIPNSVTMLGQVAFYNNRLSAVTISENLTTIESYAFGTNLLTSINIPDNIKTIGFQAFYNNRLTSVTLSENIIEIGNNAFYANWSLQSITLPIREDLEDYRWVASASYVGELNGGDNITDYSTSYTAKWYDPYEITLDDVEFDKTTGTISEYLNTEHDDIIIPSSLNVDGVDYEVKIIGTWAFSRKDLETVELANTLNTIAASAFYGNNLKSITIPNGVETIGEYAFYQNRLEEVSIPASVITIQNSAFNYNELINLDLPEGVQRVFRNAFSNNEIVSLTIPSSITYLEGMAFNRNSITTINDKPSNGLIYKRNDDSSNDSTTVISYGGAASKIDFIPTETTTIADGAFYKCILDTVIIPNSVTTIGTSAFHSCRIKSLTLSASLETIESYAFSKNQLSVVDIPASTNTIGEEAFNTNSLQKVNMTGNLRHIGAGAFNRNLIDTLNGESFNSIFYARNADGTECRDTIVSFGNVRIKVDYIPEGVVHIGKRAFYYANLDTIVLPNSLLSIGESSLYVASTSEVVFPTHPDLETLGWEDESDNTYACGDILSKNLYKPIYIPHDYSTITYELDGGSNSTDNPAYFIHNNGVASFYNASKEGKTFEGWYDADQNKVESIAIGTDTNVVLYAKWKDYSTAINTTESIMLEVYPNPATDFIKITSSSNAPIEIYNLSSLLIKEVTRTNIINISELYSGIYLLKQGNFSARFIKK